MKNVFKAVSFTAIVVAVLMLLSPVLVPKNNSEEWGMENDMCSSILAEPENTIDALFLGDSEVYAAFSPRQIYQETGITSYDCSVPAMKLYYAMTVLERVMERQSPQVVFFETNAIFRHFDEDAAMLEEAGKVIPALYYHDRWKNLRKEDFTQKPFYDQTMESKGFHSAKRADAVKQDELEAYMEPENGEERISPVNLWYMKRIHRYITDNGSEMVLVSTPSTTNWNSRRHNAMEALAGQLGVTYLDLNLVSDEIGIDWETDTRDGGDHLNRAGAKKVTAYMAGYMEAMNCFPDHREDLQPIYDDWNFYEY